MLTDSIYNSIVSIIGSPSSDVESLCLYVVSCFLFVLSAKLIYDLLSYLFGLKG